MRKEALPRGPDSRDEPSSAHRYEHGPDLREIPDNLQADRPLSRDRGRLRERVDEGGGPRPPSLVLVGVDQVRAGDRGDVRSLGGDRLDLAPDGPFRDADRAGQAEPPGRPGAGKAMG